MANDTLIQPCTGDLSLLPTVISLPTWHLPKSLNTVSSTTAGTIVHAEGNETVGPPVFAVLAIRSNQWHPYSLSCHGKVVVASGTIPQTDRTLTSGQRVGCCFYFLFFSFSVCVQLPAHVQWEMFDHPKRKKGYISSLTSLHDAFNAAKKVHIPQGVPANTHRTSSEFTSWPLK